MSPFIVGEGGYPTADELVAESDSEELKAATPSKLEVLRRLAIKHVEGFTGQVFTPEERTAANPLLLDGPGGRELWLERRLERLDSITVKGSSVDVTDVEVSDKGDRIAFTALNHSYAVEAMRETAYDVRTFRSGADTISLTGILGWSVVPADVVMAIVEEMAEQARADSSGLAGTVSAYRRLGIRQAMQGNLNLTIGDPSSVSPNAAVLLGDYVWTRPGLMV